MTGLILLRVPPGAESAAISHGDQEFDSFRADPNDPESDHLVRVPPHAVANLIHNAGFELMPEENHSPAPVGTALLAHKEGPRLPDGSPRIVNGISPGPDGRYAVPVSQVHELLSHGLDAPERVAGALKTKLEEALGAVDGAEVSKEIADAVARATAQADADRDEATARALTAEADLAAARAAAAAYQGAADVTVERANAARDAAVADLTAAREVLTEYDKKIDKVAADRDAAAARAETAEKALADASQKALEAARYAAESIMARDKEIAALKAQVEAAERESTALLNEAQVAKAETGKKKS